MTDRVLLASRRNWADNQISQYRVEEEWMGMIQNQCPVRLTNTAAILCIGYSTIPWALYYAETHPSVNVVAMEEPSYMDRVTYEYPRPSNYRACGLKSLEELSGIDPSSQDLIRVSKLSLRVCDSPTFLHKIRGLLKPGGWLEIFDVSRVYTAHNFSPWCEASRLFGTKNIPSIEAEPELLNAGFCEITMTSNRYFFDTPVGRKYVESIYTDLKEFIPPDWEEDRVKYFFNCLQRSQHSEAGMGL